MAGEWIAVDLALDSKPEVQELVDLTGQPVEAVCFRLWKLWGWASMNTVDGTARMTIPRLVRTCGGDVAFWEAVASVGWLEIDETAATVAIPGWDRRFSKAAKERAQARDRASDQRARTAHDQVRHQRTPPCATGAPEERRGEVPPPPREASQDEEAWQRLRTAWNAGSGTPWTPEHPPEKALERLAVPGWIDEALAAIARLPRCRYFTTPVSLPQLCSKPGFARDVAGGRYDEVSKPKPRHGAPDEKPPPKAFEGEDAAAFQRTLRKLAGKTG